MEPSVPSSPMPQQRYLSTAEAAAYLGISTGHLENMRYEGRGPRHFRLERRYRYSREDLDAWVRRHPPRGEQLPTEASAG